MNLNERIKELAASINSKLEFIKTEEATKNAFVMPFIAALGYDVFNPQEVIPEFTADVATKKGEKVDYAIKKDGSIIMLMECKQCDADLSVAHKDQLYRYFSVTETKFAILTNGIRYQFFSDIDAPNKMDEKPFFEFDMTNYNESHVEELSRFAKSAFDLEKIINIASDLKYANAIKREFFAEISKPSEDFVRFLMSKVYTGRQSHGVIDQFTNIVERAIKESVSELISSRLQSALREEKNSLNNEASNAESPMIDNGEKNAVITEREIEGYNIIKAIARSVTNVSRINISQGKSYSAVLLDNKKRKTICRMHFNAKRKFYIELFKDNVLQRFDITTVDDIFNYAELIQSTVKYYLSGNEIANESEITNGGLTEPTVNASGDAA